MLGLQSWAQQASWSPACLSELVGVSCSCHLCSPGMTARHVRWHKSILPELRNDKIAVMKNLWPAHLWCMHHTPSSHCITLSTSRGGLEASSITRHMAMYMFHRIMFIRSHYALMSRSLVPNDLDFIRKRRIPRVCPRLRVATYVIYNTRSFPADWMPGALRKGQSMCTFLLKIRQYIEQYQ